mgnify:CR=1 FL=1
MTHDVAGFRFATRVSQHTPASSFSSRGRVLRSVFFGAGAGRPPELRFMAPTAEEASDAETMTALGTTRGDDLAAATGGHANQEAVSALAADLARLICTLHVSRL